MHLNLNIKRIILEGVDLPRSQRSRLQVAVSTELSRLLTENGLPTSLQKGGAIPSIPATVSATKGMSPEEMGKEIAQSIYRGMRNEASGISSTAK